MIESSTGLVEALGRTMTDAIGQTINIANQEIKAESPDMSRIGQCLRLGNLLSCELDSLWRGNTQASAASLEPSFEPEGDPAMAEITARLRGAWIIRKNALINYSPNSKWSYNIPKKTFVKVVETIKGLAPQGQFPFDEMVMQSGIKDSHVYRVYVLLFRAGLMRQQKANVYFINEQEADQLNPELIWKYIPYDPLS